MCYKTYTLTSHIKRINKCRLETTEHSYSSGADAFVDFPTKIKATCSQIGAVDFTTHVICQYAKQTIKMYERWNLGPSERWTSLVYHAYVHVPLHPLRLGTVPWNRTHIG